jgi:hypothetical protein
MSHCANPARDRKTKELQKDYDRVGGEMTGEGEKEQVQKDKDEHRRSR